MTVRTTLSFTDRHHRYLTKKVMAGQSASQSALVAVALEQMIRDDEERELALAAIAETIRTRMQTPREAFAEPEAVFADVRGRSGPAGR